VALEKTRDLPDDGLLSQVGAWLDPHSTAADSQEDGTLEVADWLPLVLAASFIIADVATTLTGHGDLLSAARLLLRGYLR
jgi:hypothetical protein